MRQSGLSSTWDRSILCLATLLGRVQQMGGTMTKRSTGRGQGRAKPNTEAARMPAKSTTRRQIMDLCERVEELMLAMERLVGGVLAFELGVISDRLHEAVVAG